MTLRNIITASTGWYVLRLTGSDRSGNYGIDRELIVGWETTMPADEEWAPPDLQDGGHCLPRPWPVTENSRGGLARAPVLSPDGRVRLAGGEVLGQRRRVAQACGGRSCLMRQ